MRLSNCSGCWDCFPTAVREKWSEVRSALLWDSFIDLRSCAKYCTRAYPGETVGVGVPDGSEVNITVQRVTRISGSSGVYRSYVWLQLVWLSGLGVVPQSKRLLV